MVRVKRVCRCKQAHTFFLNTVEWHILLNRFSAVGEKEKCAKWAHSFFFFCILGNQISWVRMWVMKVFHTQQMRPRWSLRMVCKWSNKPHCDQLNPGVNSKHALKVWWTSTNKWEKHLAIYLPHPLPQLRLSDKWNTTLGPFCSFVWICIEKYITQRAIAEFVEKKNVGVQECKVEWFLTKTYGIEWIWFNLQLHVCTLTVFSIWCCIFYLFDSILFYFFDCDALCDSCLWKCCHFAYNKEEMFASSVMQVYSGRLITFCSDFPKPYSELKRCSWNSSSS